MNPDPSIRDADPSTDPKAPETKPVKATDRRKFLAIAGLGSLAACTSSEVPSQIGAATREYGERAPYVTAKRDVRDTVTPGTSSTGRRFRIRKG